MEITLNNVKTLDHLKGIIATKYPWVKMHSDYLSLKYQGVKLTIEPKKNSIYDVKISAKNLRLCAMMKA